MAQHGGSTIYQKDFSLFTTTFFSDSLSGHRLSPPFNVMSGVFRKKATNLLRNQSYKVGSSLAGGPAIRLRDTSWRLGPSSPVGWRRGPETKFIPWRRPAFLQVRDSSSGLFLPRKTNPNGLKLGGLQRCYDGNHLLKLSCPLQKLGNQLKNWNRSDMLPVWTFYSYSLP